MDIGITIEGTVPMLMNRFTDEAAQAATSGTRKSAVGQQLSPEDDAESRLYTDEHGNIIMPQPNLLMCITAAGKFFKNGKSKISTQKSSLIPACLAFKDVAYRVKGKGGKGKASWSVDTRPVRIPSTGGRILRHRPIFHAWSISFDVDLDTDIISEGLLREIVDAAGKRIGLCDFRPDCRGPFGRFVVTKWAVKEEPKSKRKGKRNGVPASVAPIAPAGVPA